MVRLGQGRDGYRGVQVYINVLGSFSDLTDPDLVPLVTRVSFLNYFRVMWLVLVGEVL